MFKEEERKDDEERDEEDEDEEGQEDEDEDEESEGDEEGEDEDEEPEDDEGDEDEDEDEDADFSDEDLNDPEKRKAALLALKKAKSALKQRAIWKDRAKKLGYGKEQQEESSGTKAKKKNDQQAADPVLEARRLNELTNFRLDHPDIPSLMVKEIEDFARVKGISMEAALKKPLVKSMVNNKKLKERLSNASVRSKHRGPQSKPPVDWSKATPEQLAAHRDEIRRRAAATSRR